MIPALLWWVLSSALGRYAVAECTLGAVEGPILSEVLADTSIFCQSQARDWIRGCADSGPCLDMIVKRGFLSSDLSKLEALPSICKGVQLIYQYLQPYLKRAMSTMFTNGRANGRNKRMMRFLAITLFSKSLCLSAVFPNITWSGGGKPRGRRSFPGFKRINVNDKGHRHLIAQSSC